jgi:hypothetical protein
MAFGRLYRAVTLVLIAASLASCIQAYQPTPELINTLQPTVYVTSSPLSYPEQTEEVINEFLPTQIIPFAVSTPSAAASSTAAPATRFAPQRHARIVFAGDIVEGRWGDSPGWHLSLEESLAGVMPSISQADMAVLNIEGGICDPSIGSGYSPLGRYVMWVTPSSIIGMQSSGPRVAVYNGNNHAMNLGEKCLIDGMAELAPHSIDVFGAGIDLEDARQPWTGVINGIPLVIFGYAPSDVTPESAFATSSRPGVVPMDLEYLAADLAKAPKDAVKIVMFHGGFAYTESISQSQVDYAVAAAENGADLVIGSGPHVIQRQAVYTTSYGKQVPIFFSIGNGMMDQCNVPGFNESQAMAVRQNLWLELSIEEIPGGGYELGFKPHYLYQWDCMRPQVLDPQSKDDALVLGDMERRLFRQPFEFSWYGHGPK